MPEPGSRLAPLAGAGGARVTVTARCPGCGAPLGMDAASRAVRCEFCRTTYAISGHREYLTTFLEPRVSPEAAHVLARKHLREHQVHATEVQVPRLVFVPYWRWQSRLFRWNFGSRLVAPRPGALEEMPRSNIVSRDFDLTWPAVSLHTGLAGLSTRPSVLEVQAFDPEALPAGSHWMQPETGAAAAIEAGLARASALLAPPDDVALEAERCVQIQPSLMLMFFPFFEVRHRFRDGECSRVLVDAVGGEVTADQGSCPAGEEPGLGWRPNFAGLEFLPLLCPDCTFALDLKPRFEVCRCPNCHRALEVSGGRLIPIEETSPRSAGGPGERRLPFWVFSGVMSLPGASRVGSVSELRKLVYAGSPGEACVAGGDSLDVWVPAFECRHADKLLELSARFTLFESAWEAGGEAPAGGCLLSQEGARPMVELCLLRTLAVAPRVQAAFEKAGRYDPSGARLAWIAFQPVGPELQEARTGAVLTENLLEAWS